MQLYERKRHQTKGTSHPSDGRGCQQELIYKGKKDGEKKVFYDDTLKGVEGKIAKFESEGKVQ